MISKTDPNAPPTYFTQKEIDAICFLGESLPELDAGTVGTRVNDHAKRATEVTWIPPAKDSLWLFEKLWPLFADQWRVNRIGMLQYTIYRPGGHYSWHNDNGLDPRGQAWHLTDISNRVATAVINLSRPEDFKGGGLEIIYPGGPVKAPTHRGSTTVFTSTMYHRVKPVTKGVRKTLVAWALR
jgi:PKHD-type hydroxylase